MPDAIQITNTGDQKRCATGHSGIYPDETVTLTESEAHRYKREWPELWDEELIPEPVEADEPESGEAGSSYPYDDENWQTLVSQIRDGQHDEDLELIIEEDHREDSVVEAARERLEALEADAEDEEASETPEDDQDDPEDPEDAEESEEEVQDDPAQRANELIREEGTIGELEDVLAEIDDAVTLQSLRDLEAENRDRDGAHEAIRERIEALEDGS